MPQAQWLIRQGFGLIGYRLTTQSADLVHIASTNKRHKLVNAQRQEFDAFTELTKYDTPPRRG
ncbi:hypothetical protein GA0115244_118910, partial [Streptomyces sp. DvalAA-19]